MALFGLDLKEKNQPVEELVPLTNKHPEDHVALCVSQIPASSCSLFEVGLDTPSPNLNGVSSDNDLKMETQANMMTLLHSSETHESMSSSFSHEEMNKLFEAAPCRLSLENLVSGTDVVGAMAQEDLASKPSLSEYYHVDESDYSNHRRFCFPHVHQPLRSMSSRSLKSSTSSPVIEKLHKKKRKKKKKKHKYRSFPSRNAMQSPTILEEDEIDLPQTDDETEGSDNSDDELLVEDDLLEAEGEMFADTLPVDVQTSPSSPATFHSHISSPVWRVPIIECETDMTGPCRVQSVDAVFFLGDERLDNPIHNTSNHLAEDQSSLKHEQVLSTDRVAEPSSFLDMLSAEEPQLSSRAASVHLLAADISNNHQVEEIGGLSCKSVQFTVGDVNVPLLVASDEGDVPLQNLPTTGMNSTSFLSHGAVKSMTRVASTESTMSKHRHHHRHEHFRPQDLIMRRHKGSEVRLNDLDNISPTELDEAKLLHKADLDQMTSHRFEQMPGMHRPKIAKRKGALHSIVHVGKSQREKRERFKRKLFDHNPHEVFVELDELHMSSDTEFEWREKARWIKFEEDVEEGAERWGKPHVASLSFHSLLELRKGIEEGIMMLDLEADDLQSIVNAVVDRLVLQDLLQEEDKGKMLRTLLLKHKHVSGRSPFLQRTKSCSNLASLERHQSEKSMLNRIGSSGVLHRPSAHHSDNVNQGSSQSAFEQHYEGKAKLELQKVDVDNNTMDNRAHIALVPTEQHKRQVQDIMRRIPKGSEVSVVLVGQVDYVRHPTLAFVRLSEGRVMENLTEVPLPVRFVFLLIGPEKGSMDYHEVGRSISTLMSNQAFHEVAYHAENRDEMLHAINMFLDESIVLPPGDWDQKTLIPIMDMAHKRANKDRRHKQKEKELMEKNYSDIPWDPLRRTGRLFGGLINDIKRRYPCYVSDLTDAISFKCVMATIFIFFACISPCIAFGGLLAEKTHGLIGVTETILCTSLSGMVFSLFCGQPLMLIGATGPVLLFEQTLYKFAESHSVEFLPMRCWIGFYVAVISVIVVALEGSYLVKFVTRFAEEIFAILISIVFIYEVVKQLVHIFKQHPLVTSYNCPINISDGGIIVIGSHSRGDNHSSLFNGSHINSYFEDIYREKHSNVASHHGYDEREVVMQPNTALLSLILTIGAFLIAYFLRIFRNSRFLGRSVRRALGDFGVLIAILAMSLLDHLMADTYTQKLSVQDSLQLTRSDVRNWFINPMGVQKKTPLWIIFASIVPAILIFILLFLEVQITEMILNKKERKLTKGTGFHLDQLIMGLMSFVLALFGLPWMCAATVRTMAHVSALSSYSKTHAPGEKPQLVGVKEQRVTNFAVHCCIGLSLLLGPVLQAIPVMALFGILLYLGVSAMSGVQMFERIKLLLMPIKHHPSVGYVRRVRMTRMHLFTVIQLLLLLVLLAVKSTSAALIFPFIIILLLPIRHQIINRIFTKQELHELDREEEDSEVEDEEDPDFYQMAHMPI